MSLAINKQPLLGIVAIVATIAVSFGFIALFEFPLFAGWVSVILVCAVPLQLVIGPLWHGQKPAFIANADQPLRGILYTVATLVIAALVAIAVNVMVGDGSTVPKPPVVMFVIFSVVVSFWHIIIWGAWPETAFIKNPLLAGVVALVAIYLITYLLFAGLFDFRFMSGAPVYVAAIDPQGLFNAWQVLAFGVTTVAALFVLLNLEFWPLSTRPSWMQQPLMGIAASGCVLLIAAAAFFIFTRVLQMDVVVYLALVPVTVIFGSIIALNMLQQSLWPELRQPLKGLLNLVVVVVSGQVLYRVYLLFAPILSGELSAGPPAYEVEIWMASAMLAVTFPFLILVTDFFQFRLTSKK